jgi:hypothetical protein
MALLAAAMSFSGEPASTNVDRMPVVAVAGIVRRPGSLDLDRKPPLISFLLCDKRAKSERPTPDLNK